MKQIKPMLIKHEQPPFDDDDYIYELKLDGIRCIAHLTKTSTDLRNKRTQKLLPKFPELTQLHKQIKKSCILDGELYIFKDGITDFFEIQKRTLMSNPFKISLASKQYPATFTAFDILEIDGECVTHEPLIKRKQLLQSIVKENERFNIQKNGTFDIEHVYSQNYNAIKAHYFFIQFAHTIRQLLEKGIKYIIELKISKKEVSALLTQALTHTIANLTENNKIQLRFVLKLSI